MMNMVVVKQVLDYIRGKYSGYFQPVMTTNGTLLTLKNAGIMVEHDVSLAISIDGPSEEHNRFRVDVHGKGSLHSNH